MIAVRRVLRIAAAVLVLGLVYGAGVVTGVLGSGGTSGRGPSVVDEAEARIAAAGEPRVTRSGLEQAAVRGMLDALGDRWSSYVPPADYASFRDVLDGHYTGVGVWVRRTPTGSLVVSTVSPGSPAATAGLHAGDEVLAVGGVPSRRLSVAAAVAALRGNAGSRVDLEVRRLGRVRSLRLTRTALDAGDVSARRLPSGVLVVTLSAFSRGVGRQVRALVEGAHRPPAILLDLRDDPGGLLDEAVETASAFLDGGVVVTYEQRGAAPEVLRATGHGDTTTPLAVLVDSATASAAEVVAGALQDRRRAVLVGSRTFGKGSVQEPSRLSDGSALELTVGRYRTPSGRLLDGVGLDPDIEVAVGSPPEVAVSRALQVLVGLVADSGTAGHG